MKYTTHINGWENFTVVGQDVPGVVVTTGGGLYTQNLMNCMCLILTNEEGKYGMLHVNPSNENIATWVKSLREQVGANAAIIAGANGLKNTQSDERIKTLAACLKGLTVVDETRDGWVPDELHPNRGSNKDLVGYVAVSAVTGEYALSTLPFQNSTNLQPDSDKALRKSADGSCTIQ